MKKETSATHKRFLANTCEIRAEFPNPKNLDADTRAELYAALESKTGNTPLRFLQHGKGGVWMKDESAALLTETHYDRCFVPLLKDHEFADERPYDPREHTLCEVTTGSAGVSFGAIGGKLLGYKTKIFIPPIEKVREDLIKEVVGVVDVGENGFLSEAVERFRADFMANRRGAQLKAPDHSRDSASPDAFTQIAQETIRDLIAQGVELDAFVCAVGNGTSIKGIASELRKQWPRMEVHGFEDANGGAAHYRIQGKDVPPISGKIDLYGAGGVGSVHMPVVDEIIRQGLLKTSVLVGRSDWSDEFENWNVGRVRAETIGRTSAAALWRAKQLIAEGKRNVLTVIYDKADRYGDVWVTDEEAVYLGDGQWRQEP